MAMNPETNYVRLRGLPFAAKEADVRNFLQGITAKTVTFTLTSSGRASGECYVELTDVGAAKEARKFDRNEISGRYIEVFPVTEGELAMMIRHGVLKSSSDVVDPRYSCNYVVRLRGLPYSATVDDIKAFFSGLDVADVVIDKEQGGRPSGEAFVRLATKQHAEMALERSKNYMGSRYVEVFRSSAEEMENSIYCARGIPPPSSGPVPLRGLNQQYEYRYSFRDRYNDNSSGRYNYGSNGHAGYGGGTGYGPVRTFSGRSRPSPYDRPYERERYGRQRFDDTEDFGYDAPTKVFMRGLPYNVTAVDIEDFFKPLHCMEIKLGYNDERRLSGDGIVTFSSPAEARDALTRNKKNIGTRYIELFPANAIPYPVKCAGFRVISFARGPPRNYNAFSEDDEFGFGGYNSSASGGQQYYNDQYEGRQSKYSREWGEPPTRAAW